MRGQIMRLESWIVLWVVLTTGLSVEEGGDLDSEGGDGGSEVT